jgi:hypothetical protein
MKNVIENELKDKIAVHIASNNINFAAKKIISEDNKYINYLKNLINDAKYSKIFKTIVFSETEFDISVLSQDVDYLIDIGLVSHASEAFKISNLIYFELAIREFIKDKSDNLTFSTSRWFYDNSFNEDIFVKDVRYYFKKIQKPSNVSPTFVLEHFYLFLEKLLQEKRCFIQHDTSSSSQNLNFSINYHDKYHPFRISFINNIPLTDNAKNFARYTDFYREKFGNLVVFDIKEKDKPRRKGLPGVKAWGRMTIWIQTVYV